MISQDQQEKIIGGLLKKPENVHCADCNSKSPCWASLDFGVFICMNCSGAHRALGPSITRVKSTKLDTWNRDWLWHMQLGNSVINQYFEYTRSDIINKKPNFNSSLQDIKKFVHDKYVKRLYAMPDQDHPISNLKNGKPAFQIKEQPEVQAPPQLSYPPIKATPIFKTTAVKKKDVDLLGDDISERSNKSQSMKNQQMKEDMNLFDLDDVQETSQAKNYNREHFNSFSGRGAQHSTTGQITFDTLFTNQASSNKVSFDEFPAIISKEANKAVKPSPVSYEKSSYQTNPNPNPNPNLNYNPTPNTNTYYGYGQHPQGMPHVTMNINMNMQPMFMNINLSGASQSYQPQPYQPQSQQHQPTPQTTSFTLNSLSSPITLEQLKQAQPKKAEEKKSSWTDEWK